MTIVQQPPTPSPSPVRKAYQKPRLEKVRLVPEEAVLNACKNIDGFAGFGAISGCTNAGDDCLVIAS